MWWSNNNKKEIELLQLQVKDLKEEVDGNLEYTGTYWNYRTCKFESTTFGKTSLRAKVEKLEKLVKKQQALLNEVIDYVYARKG